ncbi:MAG: chorismate mutase [Gammaproteobacteria bacterium]|nr:chorismate mutase [Gammaproteobacteria bacterium]MDH5629404.1 chorismate mutase [Gammaproteobacteria bacterium]
MTEVKKEFSEQLANIRLSIDKIDESIVELLKQRSECVKQIAIIKCSSGQAIYDQSREATILDNIVKNNPTNYQSVDLANIFHAILRAGLNQQLLFRSELKD